MILEIHLDSINIEPAMTYFRAGRTIIGPRCLSAVFGMGTGVSTWAWSPASRCWRAGTRERPESNVYGVLYNVGDASSVLRLSQTTGEGMVRSSVRLLVPVH